MSPRTRSLLFFAGCLVAAAGFTRLGVWQLSRLGERRALNATALAARALPPIVLDDPVDAARLTGASANNRRVRVTGRYDHAAEIVIRGQSEAGVPGVRIVTPFRPLRGDTAVLVHRGFVTSGDARRVDLDSLHEDGVVTVTGIAFDAPATGVAGEPREEGGQLTWRRLDLGALRQRLPYPLQSYTILQLPDSALPKLPRRDDPPVLDDGPHLSYAIQWFSFALTALVVGTIIGFRKSSA
jgi:surfeit locus 1 family protein